MLTRRDLLKALPLSPLVIPAASAASASQTVRIRNMRFSPADMTIEVGTAVNFTNSDNVAHTATSASGDWDTGNLAAGKSTTITFNETGTHDYFCRWHPAMKGRIIVV